MMNETRPRYRYVQFNHYDDENNLVAENKSEVIRKLDKAYSDGIISKSFRDRNKSKISKLK